MSTTCAFDAAFSSAFEICVTADPHPIHRLRRVRVTYPPRRRVRVQVDSEIVVVSEVRPRVGRPALVPAVVSSALAVAFAGVATPHVWRRDPVASDVELAVVGMLRASVDDEAEIMGLALGVSAEIAQELV